MTDFLVSGPLTVDEIIEIIRVQSRDETSSPVFSDNSIKLALRQAVLNSHGSFFTTHTTTLSFTSGTNEYIIADDIQRITGITREQSGGDPIITTVGSVPFDIDLVSYRHFNYGPGQNTLIFFRDYPTGTLNIYYERDVPIPLENRALGAAISSTSAATMTLTNASPQLYRTALPCLVRIDNEIIKITAISGNTTATIVRGQLGSTAATHINGSVISWVVRAESDSFYNFLFSEIGKWLNLWRVQAGSGQLDVSANLTAARLFGDNADKAQRQHPQTKRTRKMKFKRSRRPRRAF